MLDPLIALSSLKFLNCRRLCLSTLIAALGSQQTVQTSSTQASAINSRSVNCCSSSPGLESGSVDCSDGTISSSEDEHDTVVEERHLNLHQAPADPWGLGPSLPQSCMSSDSFFAPLTSEKDPEILDPSPSLTSQAIQCQQLGSTGWNRVRYLEAEKTLKRTGVFKPLEMNQLFTPPPSATRSENKNALVLLPTDFWLNVKHFINAANSLAWRLNNIKFKAATVLKWLIFLINSS